MLRMRRTALLLCLAAGLLAWANPARARFDALDSVEQGKIRSIAEMHAAMYGVDRAWSWP